LFIQKALKLTLEPHFSSEARHIFVKNKKACANVLKEAPQQLCCQRTV